MKRTDFVEIILGIVYIFLHILAFVALFIGITEIYITINFISVLHATISLFVITVKNG